MQVVTVAALVLALCAVCDAGGEHPRARRGATGAAAPAALVIPADGREATVGWFRFFGPYPIGKTELDAELGALAAASNGSAARASEYMPDARVRPSIVRAPAGGAAVDFAPSVAWRELYSQLGTASVLEFQAAIETELSVSSDGVVLVACMGLSAFRVDGMLADGELFATGRHWGAFALTAGARHVLSARLRAKVQASVRCVARLAPARATPSVPAFVVFPPRVPDVHRTIASPVFARGRAPRVWLALPVLNTAATVVTAEFRDASVPLADLRVRLVDPLRVLVPVSESESDLPSVGLGPPGACIGPGQTLALRVALEQQRACAGPVSVRLELVHRPTGVALGSVDAQLLCRDALRHESFLFGFVDHDGSVGLAAAIAARGLAAGAAAPLLLSLHGTGVSARDSADAFKRAARADGTGELEFGVDGAHVLAPHRAGAHNHEYTGLWSANAAIAAFAHDILAGVRVDALVVVGHSMGAHGAWVFATTWPDRVRCVAPIAGWIAKESYGEANAAFDLDVGVDYSDAALRGVLLSSADEYATGLAVSNLRALDAVHVRVGTADAAVSPWFSRRMVRLALGAGVNVTMDELPAREHWWWDTSAPNDGGVVNDPRMRAFFAWCVARAAGGRDERALERAAQVEVVRANAAEGGSVAGVSIGAARVPGRAARVRARRESGREPRLVLDTRNVRELSLAAFDALPLGAQVHVDGVRVARDRAPGTAVAGERETRLCRDSAGQWARCELSAVSARARAARGPMRVVLARPFVIVYGTDCVLDCQSRLLRAAVLLGDLHELTTHAHAALVRDVDYKPSAAVPNAILIGGASVNRVAATLCSLPLDVRVNESAVVVGGETFRGDALGAVYLAPWRDPQAARSGVALVVDGVSMSGLDAAVNLGIPTIPPMARAPFTNLVPDFIVIDGAEVAARGVGAVRAAGWLDDEWRVSAESSFLTG